MPISGMCCLSGRARNRSAERYRKGTETLVRGVREYIRRGFHVQFFSLFSFFLVFIIFSDLLFVFGGASHLPTGNRKAYGTVRYSQTERMDGKEIPGSKKAAQQQQ